MAQNFFPIRVGNYKGPLVSKSYRRGNQAGTLLRFDIDWSAYIQANAASFNVICNFQTVGTGGMPIGFRPISIFIDNTQSNVPIYCFAPDTGYSVVAESNSSGWFPWISNQNVVWIIGIGFAALPLTTVMLTDLWVPPYVDQEIVPQLWKASANVSRGGNITNQNYGAPALGDQVINATISLIAGNEVTLNFQSVTGFVYLTALAGVATVSGGNILGTSLSASIINVTALNQQLWVWSWNDEVQSATVRSYDKIFPIPQCQLKVDATNIIKLRCTSGINQNGLFNANLVYTTNPT